MSKRPMVHKRLVLIPTVALLLGVVPPLPSAQDLSGTQPYIEMKGSIPPVADWYSCIREMRGQPFDQNKIDGCLHSVLSHPQLTSGKVSIKHHRRFAEVTFFLGS